MDGPFEALGIEPTFDVDLGALEKRVRAILSAVHPDRHAGKSAAERRLALSRAVDVNEAWRIVRDPVRRAEALLARAGVATSERAADPAFLMDVMELREALAEARATRDAVAVARLADDVRARERATLAALSTGFRALAPGAPAEELARRLGELRYFRRFLDEVSAIDDELGAPSAAHA